MDAYAYAILAGALLMVWMILFGVRADLRASMLRESCVGGIAGLLAELWYFRDYWHPPTLMGQTRLSPEDFVVGFAITGIGRALYDVLLRYKDGPEGTARNTMLAALFLAGVAGLVMGNTILGWNSCITSEGIFAALTAVMVYLRPDLGRAALGFALLLGALGFGLYLIIFGLLAPDFWREYWLLKDTPFGITLLGIPLTEILWFVTWGSMAGVAHNFRTGKKRIKL